MFPSWASFEDIHTLSAAEQDGIGEKERIGDDRKCLDLQGIPDDSPVCNSSDGRYWTRTSDFILVRDAL